MSGITFLMKLSDHAEKSSFEFQSFIGIKCDYTMHSITQLTHTHTVTLQTSSGRSCGRNVNQCIMKMNFRVQKVIGQIIVVGAGLGTASTYQ